MALDRQKHKSLQNAERLLKQGKVQEALAELDRVAVTAPSDLLTLNRMGDLLARQGRRSDAIRYYLKIAEEFTRAGFYPKAVAIHKKILRLSPDHPESLIALGELYLHQTLPGEARRYLLHAAEKLLEAKEFAGARAVYERLVAAEPSDARHRARLAEARAAEGDTEQAGEELLLLAETLFSSGKPGEAEKSYRRAGELLGPERPEPLLGVCRSLKETGQAQQALEKLEEAVAPDDANRVFVAELAVHYAAAEREAESLELFQRPGMLESPPEVLLRFFRFHIDNGTADRIWEKFDPILQTWAEKDSAPRTAALLARLGTLEAQGHIPALQRLYDLNQRLDDKTGTIRALEELIRAYGSRSMSDEASLMKDRLRELAPHSAALGKSAAAAPRAPKPGTEPAQDPEAASSQTQDDAPSAPVDAELPAVPLNRADEEYITGRLTQAEILEKYGLIDQAIGQIAEIIAKFPGHVPAQERCVELLRASGDRPQLREALLGLAHARRALGETDAAREAAAQAVRIESPDDEQRAQLERLGLIDPPAPPAPEPVASPPDSAAAELADDDSDAVVIDFDEEPAESRTKTEPAAPAPARKPVRAPGPDMLEEIRTLLEQGETAKAEQQVRTLQALGYASEELDGLVSEIASAPASAPAQPVAPPPPAAAAPPVDKPPFAAEADDDDLSTITAALEGELFEEDAEAAIPETQSEQSLEDVFATFKQHVAEEVDSDDFRTHYDLGIAYKEMGLIDESIREFETAAGSSEIACEAYIMIALCQRERDDLEQAIASYRRAIDTSGNADSLPGLRYDLADTLLASGETAAALDIFRDLLSADPGFRDVKGRVAELETRQTS